MKILQKILLFHCGFLLSSTFLFASADCPKKPNIGLYDIRREIYCGSLRAQELAKIKYSIFEDKMNLHQPDIKHAQKEVEELEEIASYIAKKFANLKEDPKLLKNIGIALAEGLGAGASFILAGLLGTVLSSTIGGNPQADVKLGFGAAIFGAGCATYLIMDASQRVYWSYKATDKDYLENVENNREFFQKLIVEARSQQGDNSDPQFINN